MLSSLVNNFWNINRKEHIKEILPRSPSLKWDDFPIDFSTEMNTFLNSNFNNSWQFFRVLALMCHVSLIFPSNLLFMLWCFCLSCTAWVNCHYAICHYDKINFGHSPTQDETSSLNIGRSLLLSLWLLYPKIWNISFS